jgi:hypothetical protein
VILAITILLGVLAGFAAGVIVGYSRRDRMYTEPWRNQSYMVEINNNGQEVTR